MRVTHKVIADQKASTISKIIKHKNSQGHVIRSEEVLMSANVYTHHLWISRLCCENKEIRN